jgi:(1->4)-alpha-D-glucan 1-alpha-D-glucosylmutase
MTDRPLPDVLPPSATYRVQFGPGFTFDDAAALVSYLAALGVSHLHCSPVQQAATAEQASLRIAGHSKPDEALGGPAGYRRLSEALSAAGLSQLLGVGSLAIPRVDRPEVFDDVHELPLRLVRQGSVSGLRVDHVDGLADPEGYLARLRTAVGDAVYIVADKTLGPDEKLPGSWPVAGTTGYDFLNLAGGLFVDQAGRQPILDGYASFTGQDADLAEITRAAKLQVMTEELDAEVERLTWQLAGICEHRRRGDYTRRELRAVLEELLAAFAVCRCYPRPGKDVTFADRAKVAAAVTAARQRRQDLDAELFDFTSGLLLPRQDEAEEAEFAVGFAQVSAPVMTKGTEDVAFNRYLPLACLNEIGGDPARFGGDLPDFHDAMRYTALHWPDTMLTLSTPDTKRSGDVRARMSVLSELPHAWNAAIRQWSEHNARHKKRTGKHGSRTWPDRVTEYLLYQTIVGAWPVRADRLGRYLIAAARDARLHTSWTDPQARYEETLGDFVAAVLSDTEFVAAVAAFLARHSIVARGRLNSLASTALLLTCPGVPDLYQGTEIWDLSLADPANRRPVDFAARAELLADLAGAGPQQAFARDDAGGTKLWLISRLLSHRRSNPHCYSRSSGYETLEVSGPGADRFVAFARSAGVAVVVPRLATSAADPWTGTSVGLPPGRWASVLTGEAHQGGEAEAADLLRLFPVQVLARED